MREFLAYVNRFWVKSLNEWLGLDKTLNPRRFGAQTWMKPLKHSGEGQE